MTVDVIGMVSTSYGSESEGWNGPVIDPHYLAEFAQAHEDAGFDRVLIAHNATSPDAVVVAAHVLYSTQRLGVLIAQRPGFVAPTLTARALASLEHFTGAGRVAIHHITGGSDVDQRRDGDFVDKDARYRRTGEFMQIERAVFTGTEPFDHEGEFYRLEGAFSSVRPLGAGSIPLYFGGASDAALAVGAEFADTFMLWGEPLAETAERVALIRREAAAHGRSIEFSLSVRPIIADSEDEAWALAEQIREKTQSLADRGAKRAGWNGLRSENTAVGAARLQQQALEGQVHDERLWFGVTKLTDGGGNSTALVGTAEQVADALLKYHELGINAFLIRGFDPLNDVRRWGSDLIPLLRAGAAAREG